MPLRWPTLRRISHSLKNIIRFRKILLKIKRKLLRIATEILEDFPIVTLYFTVEKQERLLIIQNQQYKNEIEYQSKNLTLQL